MTSLELFSTKCKENDVKKAQPFKQRKEMCVFKIKRRFKHEFEHEIELNINLNINLIINLQT